MSFKLKANPTFLAKVSIPRPGEAPQVLELEFRHMTSKQWEDFRGRMAEMTLQECARELVVGWRDVDVEFSRGALEALLDEYMAAGMAIVSAYGKELAYGKQGN